MQKTRELASGFLLGIVALLIIAGSVALALAESGFAPTVVPPTQLPAHTAVTLPTNTFTPSQTAIIITNNVTDTPAHTATDAATLPPPPTTCPPPNGWRTIKVKVNDTLYSLAARYNITPETLAERNCLLTVELPVGSTIYVPQVPTVVPTACRPPADWVIHTVQPGDNLYRIGLKYRIPVNRLQQGNCMGASLLIYAGQRLYVPNVPTSTPDVTKTSTASPTLPATETASPSPIPPASTPAPIDTSVPTAATP